MTATVAIIIAAVLIGTVLQRVSGTGVGLVVAPVLSILLGPAFGVLLTNMTTVVSGFLIMLAVWSRIHWRRFWLIGPMAVLGAVPGAWLVGRLGSGWLSVILGGTVLAALIVSVALPRLPEWRGGVPALAAGLIGGFFNTTSGVAAPVMVIYSRLSRWDHRSFAATLQPVFMTMGAASVLAKLGMGSVELGDAGIRLEWLFPGIALTVLAGIGAGTLLARIVPVPWARRTALALAGLGGLGALVRGLTEVLG
ncbi:sulfite exporter TauE/SafE family protein [Sediminivirga luteola]|uniref:Probable membrane transporter protein n=1 Tax=Sediminivirga luteola TaxID=1774748 RepID=A0A8J2U0J2_9MICO|nr:sulfite exporter TauE/SafE family protein [Sediminivirga luteola]MCI2265022.1 sulfite exporter TauE/SafE family protein [Sediminivirga luteola]GGA25396.1 permease [Sediminivirga luteola]